MKRISKKTLFNAFVAAQEELKYKAMMWDAWAAINDRIAAEIPVPYSIEYVMQRQEFSVMLFGPGGVVVPYADPPNLDRNGSLFQILAAALDAAKAHDAAKLDAPGQLPAP